MKNLTIYHKRKQRYLWLILGAAMLTLGIGGAFFTEGNSFDFSFGISIVYLFFGIYTWYMPYVKISNNALWVSSAPFRKIKLDEIEKVKVFLDETTIISNGKETLITTQQMSEEDKERFLHYFKSIKLQIQDQAVA